MTTLTLKDLPRFDELGEAASQSVRGGHSCQPYEPPVGCHGGYEPPIGCHGGYKPPVVVRPPVWGGCPPIRLGCEPPAPHCNPYPGHVVPL
ncbi:hypothetical protein [Paraburkholderia ginsengisoli]|jgi:hypothetical protein|uniref:Uncharacterized protein n=1 Tax=Paraburkholderia ginsengisoli TaxID=311231 RepID=A0A7T4N978_9BURK|nr:hypothetical protein [Paraburkholderia ginsengisoli]QQC67574.1 hypothetical protein I6I06_21965 [Paraburkholderia ginsengisoli]